MSKLIVKLGGVAAALAGLLVMTQATWDLAVGTLGVVEPALRTTSTLLLVFGVIGMHLHQQQAAGMFGQIATLVALFGTVTFFGAALTEVTIVPALPEGSPLVDEPPPAMLAVFFVSFVAYVLGLLLFGIATWRAGVLPWRAAALLVIGIVLASALAPVVPGVLVVFGAALGWLGLATVTQARRITTNVEPAAVART